MFEFDLQMFADEEAEQSVETSAEVENTDVEAGEAEAQEPEEEKEPIPEELDGLPEEAAREVMAEAAKLDEEKAEPESEPQEIDDSQITKTQQIPYKRFKEKVDESNALKAELEAYKKQYGALNNQQPAQQEPQNFGQPAMMQPVMANNRPQQVPQLNLTPDVMKQIEELKKQEALRMSGLTQDDLDGMEYMEENDPRKQQYEFALKMAENTVMSRIQQAQMEQMRQAEAVLRAHDASVQEYNTFAQKEMSEPDFQNVMQFATQDYFFNRSPIEQQTLSEAYARIERNVASPADVMLIKNYFTEAKNAYRGGNKTAKRSNNPMTKVKQAGTFPRSQQVEGSSDNDTGVSVATLAKMLDEKPWDEIAPKYQKMLMGE
ncbi:hypothetical protein [Selenomonas sp. AE3005]|uniref:hypothetical protein n=1 Tax=Selenomonas sp. AE3005 TaxID=1485543 RepID=UPI0025CBD6F4|nr:hypothetical protein [Selenomonas sp. AE3005]